MILSFEEFRAMFEKNKILINSVAIKSTKGKPKRITTPEAMLRWAVHKPERIEQMVSQLQELIDYQDKPEEMDKMIRARIKSLAPTGTNQAAVDAMAKKSMFLNDYNQKIEKGINPFEDLPNFIETSSSLSRKKIEESMAKANLADQQKLAGLLRVAQEEHESHARRYHHGKP
jgi:replicative superfamily II helicase